MDVYRTDEEQVEAIKKWWQANGSNVFIGLGLAIFLVFGWQYWQDSKRSKSEGASVLYEQLLQAQQNLNGLQPDAEEFTTEMGNFSHLLGQLKDDFADSQYAVYGGLFAARQAVLQQDFEKAEAELRWVVEHNSSAASHLIIQLRLARVLAMQQKHQQALALIENIDAGAQTVAYEELKGDLYVALEQPDKARAAYKKAVTEAARVQGAASQRPLLQMKLDNLAVVE